MRAILFDLDQTLLDRDRSLGAFLEWQCGGMLKPYLEDTSRFISRFIELDDNGKVWKDRVYSTLVDEFSITAWSCEELLSVYVHCFCGFSVPRQGALEAVEKLSRTYRLGLVSNGMTPFQERNFRGLGLASYFDSVIVSAAVGLRKPDSAIFHLACTELGVSPHEAVYVGDNPKADIVGAQRAGLRTVFVPTELHPSCSSADLSCEDMRDLPTAIDTLGDERQASS